MGTETPLKMLAKNFLPIANECALCSKFGDFTCERCGETYCSKMCQLSDWREHRRICMPVPRLMKRNEICANVFPINRMLMDANADYDATDAVGSISEHSAAGEKTPINHAQMTELSRKLKTMEMNPSLTGITEVSSVSSTTTKVPKPEETRNVDENANFTMAAKEPARPKMLLVPPPKQTHNYSPSVQAIQPKSNVFIVHVEDHRNVFVIAASDIDKWTQLVERAGRQAATASCLQKSPEMGFIVLAKPENSELYSRACVKNVHNAKMLAKLEFIEYGFVEIVKFGEIKCLSEEMVNAPRLSNKLTLHDIAEYHEKAPDIMKYLVSMQEKRTECIVKEMTLIEKSTTQIHFNASLVHGEKFALISEIIKSLTAPEIVDEDVTGAQQSHQIIQHNGISGKNLDLFIIDNSLLHMGCFSAILNKDMDTLVKNDAIINSKAKEIEQAAPFHPRDGEICLAQSADDKRWYRATCQAKVDRDKYFLLYLDYGNMEKVPVDRIRVLVEDFAFPRVTCMCVIEGLNEERAPQIINRLKALIQPYTQMFFDECQFADEEVVCKSEAIMTTLRREGLL